jgi:hypothetical protein
MKGWGGPKEFEVFNKVQNEMINKINIYQKRRLFIY